MRLLSKVGLTILVISLLLQLVACNCNGDKGNLETGGKLESNIVIVSGVITTDRGAPLKGVRVSIDDEITITNAQGKFTIRAQRAEKETKRYVMKAEKRGYANRFVILGAGADTGTWKMPEARIISIDPTVRNVIEANPGDLEANCWTIPGRANWEGLSHLRIPYELDAEGNIEVAAISTELAQALQMHDHPIPCENNFQVVIMADSLVGANGQQPDGEVTAAIADVSLLRTWEMPGDFTAELPDGELGYMISFGAGQIHFYDNTGPLYLKKGVKAKLRIPVDPVVILSLRGGEKYYKVPDTMPLLIFDEKTGVWYQDGLLEYDAQTNAYEGYTSHFSAFNADIFKAEPATVRLDVSRIKGTFNTIVLTMLYEGSNIYIAKNIPLSDTYDDYHLFYNLPTDTDMEFQAFLTDDVSGLAIARSVRVPVHTGGGEDESLEELTVYPYNASNITKILWDDVKPALDADAPYYGTQGVINLTATYDWNAVPTSMVSSSDGYFLYHSDEGPTEGFSLIRSLLIAEPVVTFTLTPQDYAEVFTPGDHWFYVETQKLDHRSPPSSVILVNVTDSAEGRLYLSNNTEVSVLNTFATPTGTTNTQSYGQISPFSMSYINLPFGNYDVITEHGIGIVYYSWIFSNIEVGSGGTVLNLERPWPDFLTNYTTEWTWQGSGYYQLLSQDYPMFGYWSLTFTSDGTMTWRFQQMDGYGDYDSDNVASTYYIDESGFLGSLWSFTAAGASAVLNFQEGGFIYFSGGTWGVQLFPF